MKYPSALYRCSVCGYEQEVEQPGFLRHPELAEATRWGHLRLDRGICRDPKVGDLTMGFVRHVIEGEKEGSL